MSEGYTFIGSLLGPELHQYEEPVTAVAATFLIVALAAAARGAQKRVTTIVPDTKMSVRHLIELFAEFMLRLCDSTMGKENRRFLPLVSAIFIFILTMNIISLIPGVVAPTHKFTINFGMALVVFLAYNISGIRELGFFNYMKHFWGPGVVIGAFVFCVEIISHLIRPFSLSMRLFGNMTGDHLVLGVFTNLTKGIYIPVPVIFYMLGTLVCFIQAFVFTLLTMVYIRLAVAHEHGAHDDHGSHDGHGKAHHS